MSKELHYYNKYKCPVCGCEHIVIIYDKEYHYASDDEEEPKPEKIQYPFSPEGSSYTLDEFLMKATNLYEIKSENAALKEALKILRPCTDIEEETIIYATDVLGTTKPFLTVKKGHTTQHEFTRSDIDVLEEGFRILDKEEQK